MSFRKRCRMVSLFLVIFGLIGIASGNVLIGIIALLLAFVFSDSRR